MLFLSKKHLKGGVRRVYNSKRKLISLDLEYYSPSVIKVSLFESQSYYVPIGYFSLIHKKNLLVYLRRSGVFHIFQNRCTESEKETDIAILIYLRFLIKHVHYHLIDYQPFYYDLGLISKIPCDTNFIIGQIFTLLP